MCIRDRIYIPLHYYKNKKNPEVLEKGKFREFYQGIKIHKFSAAIYLFVFLLRRFLMAGLIIFSTEHMPELMKLTIFLGIQMGYMVFIVVIRPH